MESNVKMSNSNKTSLKEHAFLYCKIKNQNEHMLFKKEQLAAYLDLITKLDQEATLPLLIDLTELKRLSSSGIFSLLASNKIKSNCSEFVFIVNSLSIKLMIYNYLRLYKPLINSRVFGSLKSAMDYCSKNK